jgi:hypothetical protein
VTYPALWRPTHLGSPGGWWRADNVTLTSGKVSTWQSLVSGGHDLAQSTAGLRPTQVASVVNGRPVVRFVAANQTRMSVAFAPIQPFTLWAVVKLTSQTGSPVVVADGSNVGALYAPTATQVQSFAGVALVATFNMTTAFTTYVTVFNGGSSQLRANGTQLASGNIGSANMSTFSVGAYDATQLWMATSLRLG